MSNFREIVTKAVIGKAKKTSTNKFAMVPDETPNTILGCWVINNSFSGSNDLGSVIINGSFDVNVWYSYDNDTKTAVSTKKFSYQEKMNIPLKTDTTLDSSSEIIVRSLKQPSVTNVEIKNNTIELTIEKELGVEIVGNTKVKIAVENYESDNDDDYEEIIDESIDSEIDNLNEDYLESNSQE